MEELDFNKVKREADNFYDRGIDEHKKHNTEAALQYIQKSIELNKKIENQVGIAWAIYYKGIIFHERNLGLDEAMGLFQKALEIFRKIEENEGIGKILYNFAWIYRDKGDYKTAMKIALEHLEIRERQQNKEQIGWGRLIIAWIHSSEKNFKSAQEEFKKSIEIFHGESNERGISFAQRFYAMCLKENNLFDEALENFKTSLIYFEKTDNFWQQAICLIEMGEIFEKQEDINLADSFYNRALVLVQKVNNVQVATNILKQLAKIHQQSDLEKTTHYLKELNELEKTIEK